MFSVIIPLYNKENFIKKAVESVLGQTFPDFEIIIINDGSTDKSLDVVEQFSDERIRIISQKNQGVSAARNLGISKSTHEFITFLDADDFWESDYLELLHSLIIKYQDHVFFTVAQDSTSTKMLKEIPNINNNVAIIKDHAHFEFLYQTSCICVKRSIFNVIGGFRVGVQLGEDRDMWLRLGCKYENVFYVKPMVHHPLSTENNLARSFINYKKSFPYWEWYDYATYNRRSLFKYATKMIFYLAKASNIHGNFDDAIYLLKKCKGRDYLLKRMALFLLSIMHKSVK